MARSGGLLAGVAAVALMAGYVVAAQAHATPTAPVAECAVSSGREPARATPEQAGFDPERLAGALDFAASRNRLNVKVFRSNCLVGAGPLNDHTDHVAWNVWSVTKSVVSLLTGIAADRGLVDIADPIGRYLPPHLGDAQRRAITIENLLTETSGMRAGVVAEGITGVVPIDPNSAVQALGVPLDHEPGTVFSYSQRTVDLLSYVLELAVGEPLQQFAQRELFTPLGIERGDWYWARDRSGHTYGYAHLLIPPDDLAKLGLLVANDGEWGGREIVSARYLARATTPTATNPCYGYLFWTGPGCADSPSFLPPDTYAMAGVGLQNVFVIPSLDLVVVWTGVFGNMSRYGPAGVIAHTGELPHEFFRRLMAAFREPPVPDPGPYVEPPLEADPSIYGDTDLLLAAFGVGEAAYPGCTVFYCLGEPLAAPFTDAPPGCVVLVCLGPDPRTPGIR